MAQYVSRVATQKTPVSGSFERDEMLFDGIIFKICREYKFKTNKEKKDLAAKNDGRDC